MPLTTAPRIKMEKKGIRSHPSRKKEPMIVFSGSDKNTRKTSVTKKNTALKEKIQITKKKKKAKTAIRNRASGESVAEGQDEGNGQCSVNDRDEYEGDKG